jgi:hypothetical protein
MEKKRPEKDLVWAALGCWFCALAMVALSAWAFLYKTQFAINKEMVPISAYNAVVKWALFLMTDMSLYLGVAFFCFGYVVWNAYRKIRAAAP